MEQKTPLTLLRAGYVLLAITLILYLIQSITQLFTSLGNLSLHENMGVFWLIYLINVGYFIAMMGHQFRRNGWRFSKIDPKVYSLSLLMFSISAHSLNLSEVRLFAPYTNWFGVYVILIHLAIFVFPYRKELPKAVQYALYFVCGAGLSLAFYMLIFIGPLNLYAIPGALFLGISLHALVPFWYFLYFLRSHKSMAKLTHSYRAYWFGVLLPFVLLGFYMLRWYNIQKEVEEVKQAYEANYQDYPEWYVLGQQLADDWLTEAIITNESFNQKSFWGGSMGSIMNVNVQEKHNPLGVVADWLYGNIDINKKELFRLMEVRYDARHMTQRRLWRGDDLTTDEVSTQVEIFSTYRLAYIEKTLTISNHNNWERNQQEAVYTFYLPEGTIVTSLSLWINGVEEFSRLSTKSKADKAYETIVGVERRDPALVHWQEGNQITVTVFPCTPLEARKFKLGCTVPLEYNNGELSLDNISFRGPASKLAHSTVNIEFKDGAPKSWDGPLKFRPDGEQNYTFSGSYYPNWDLSWEAPELSHGKFSFNGFTYQLGELKPTTESFTPSKIILDINNAWDIHDWNKVWELVSSYDVYVAAPNLQKIEVEKARETFLQLRKRKYTMVPLHLIPDPKNTLIISKSTRFSPVLKDIEKSGFAGKMKQYLLQEEERVKWFQLDTKLSPFIKSMLELRMIEMMKGNASSLKQILEKEEFSIYPEDDNHTHIFHNQVGIFRSGPDTLNVGNSEAPDHIMRLFAYQQLMRDIGRQYFEKDSLAEKWIRTAEEAYVVSPISSLIVLETQKDYERMGIEENENTLGNAGKKPSPLGNAKQNNSGAAPEPHEWVLIVLASSLILWQLKKRMFA